MASVRVMSEQELLGGSQCPRKQRHGALAVPDTRSAEDQ